MDELNIYMYYVYQYLRENGTPYYIGKGKGKRAYSNCRTIPKPKDKTKIQVLAKGLLEREAFILEIKLIAHYGRIDLGTGILRNKTDGGEGASGTIWKEESKKSVSHHKKIWHSLNNTSGENNPNYGNRWSEDKRIAAKFRAEEQGFIGNRKGVTPVNKGIPMSEDQKKKLRKPKPQVICKYCSKTMAPHILSRFHGVKCKLFVASSDDSISKTVID
jgi:hypothetical protein